MIDISPKLSSQEIACAEMKAPPCGLIVFGASGDLVHRKLLPSVFELARRELLNENFFFLGCGRTAISEEKYRLDAESVIRKSVPAVSGDSLDEFVRSLYYVTGDYSDPSFYNTITARLINLERKHHVRDNRIFYLAVPPLVYGTIVGELGRAGLSCPEPDCQNIRLVVEKPFGSDLESAVELSRIIQKHFAEKQIYRIDHYLGKETVQNIMMLRFANTIFEPVWNRSFIDNVQIKVTESVGIEHRGGYYDSAGCLRDMFQNHILGMLALVGMEPPASFEADHVRDERVKLLRCIRPLTSQDAAADFVRGQYTSGRVEGKIVPAYRQEQQVEPDSNTETFVAAKLFIDNWRWRGVPFYLRAGKRLAAKDTEIAITFEKVPHSMFLKAGLSDLPSNVLVIQIQPEEGISLSFQAKRPGSKACIGTLRMQFSYSEVFGDKPPEAYQRLLLDCMLGDQTLFTRQDEVELCWRLLMPVLNQWQTGTTDLFEYPAGSESLEQADRLIEADRRKWRGFWEI